MKAYLHQVRISPKKVNLVAQLVRGKPVVEALTQLRFTPKRAAPVLKKLIESAVANAENNFKQDADKLVISKLLVNAGATLKRGNPVSRGRWHPILKRTSRITVEVSPGVAEEKKISKPTAKKTKTEKVAVEKKVEKVVTENIQSTAEEKTESKSK